MRRLRDSKKALQPLRSRAAGAGPQNDIVTHRLALPHKDVAAAIDTAGASSSPQPAIKLAFESSWC